MESFRDKVVVVTGGARGIGLEVARSMAADGAVLVLLDAPGAMSTLGYDAAGPDDLARAAESVRASGARCTTYAVDVRDRRAVAAAVDEIVRDVGCPDVVVNCAGVCSVVDADEMSDEHWAEVVDTNLHGAYNLVRAVIGPMTARGGGAILQVVGDEARRGAARLSHVSAAGWAAIGFAKSVALESAAAGVAVHVLCVGPVETALTESDAFRSAAADRREVLRGEEALAALGARHPNGAAWVSMTDVVRAARFLAASGTSATGSVLDVSAGLSALNSA
ncbi:SDR family NAD(P)-dependent oxidoreductase [Nocardioides sp. LMS-CY]|uniref:SDR family NAD(P)-dependent oxidoreductase n=1 Tax=Nocardioides sp. (strain LMS-CY) TaxID=2840457 RepID=UPI001C000354|nr:SDR family NAD(P)-dependent oxidoreductase [Nocardioides sp. LMS-CY]QWF21222.1 SDR family NAD(P)-dependent oxidoreductase [Nocardioides sp. LMS-CY]